MYRFLYWVVGFVLRRYFTVEVEGLERLPKRGGYILAANHASALDPFLLAVILPRPVHFLAKAELFCIPGVGWLLRHLGMIPVHRGHADREALTRALDLLEKGEVIGIFPEGTRSDDGHLQALHGGTAWLACQAQSPIVPAAVLGSWKLWPRGKKFPSRGRVTVIIGHPLTPATTAGHATRQQVQELSGGLAQAIGSLFRPGGATHTLSVENAGSGEGIP